MNFEDTKNLQSKILEIYSRVAEESKSLQGLWNLSCLDSCGECCFNPNITAREFEFYPLMFHLLDVNELEDFYQKFWGENSKNSKNIQGGVCVLLETKSSLSLENSQSLNSYRPGRCSAYEFRPLVCRAFGVMIRKKNDFYESSICRLIKKQYALHSEKFEDYLSSHHVNKEEVLQCVEDFAYQLNALHPEFLNQKELPINLAMKSAAEKILFLSSFHGYDKN